MISHLGEGEKLGLMQTNDEMEEADAVISALQKEIKLEKRINIFLRLIILLSLRSLDVMSRAKKVNRKIPKNIMNVLVVKIISIK